MLKYMNITNIIIKHKLVDFRLPREISVLQSKKRFPQMLTTQSFEASSQTYSSRVLGQ